MKKYIIFIAILFSWCLNGCSDFLDQDPEELNTLEKVFSNTQDTRKWFSRIYSDDYYPKELYGSAYYNHYMFGTDDANNELDWHIPVIVSGMLSPEQPVGGGGFDVYYFEKYYQAIRHCNIFLENVDKCIDLPIIEKRYKTAEARFMRAMYHFWILREYGPIPIVDYAIKSEELSTKFARNSMDECVKWICNEIDAAVPDMLETRVDDDYGFPTQAAAIAMKSRILLMNASPLYNGNTTYANWRNRDGKQLISQVYNPEKWRDAADAAKAVLDLPQFKLLKPVAEEGGTLTFDEYVDNYRRITTTINDEIIWACPQATSWWSMQCWPAVFHSWNARDAVTLNLANDYFMADGSVAPPIEKWFENKQWSTEDGNGTIANTFWMFCDREPRFYASNHFPNQRVTYATKENPDVWQTLEFWYEGNSGLSKSSGDRNSTGLSPRKNIPMDATTDKSQATATSNNIPFPTIRLGEIYLNYIEAVLECKRNGVTGDNVDFDKAMALWAELRARVNLDPITKICPETDLDRLILLLRQERRIELAWEIHRYFDVRRWFIAHGENGVLNTPCYGLDVTRGKNATDPDFFTQTECSLQRVFRLEHYFAPVRASECAYNSNLVQAPFY